MICPKCKATVDSKVTSCPNCGMQFKQSGNFGERSFNESQRAAATNSGLLLGAAARAARLNADYSNEKIIEPRMYNSIMAGVVLWGLLVNVLLCAFVGDVSQFINPALFLIIYFVSSIAGVIIAGKSRKPLISFLGYNMMVIPLGLLISTLVAEYLEADPSIVTNTLLYTLIVVAVMTGAAVAFPNFFAKLGRVLLLALGASLILGVVLMLFHVDTVIYDVVVAGIFALYIGFDIYRSQQFEKTVDNAVDCALDIYLDIANLFIRLLSIIAKSKRRD